VTRIGREADYPVSGSNVGVAWAVEGDEKGVCEEFIVAGEEFKTEWGTVRWKGGVSGCNLAAVEL